METESIDRLFLELSQFTTARTKREIYRLAMIRRAVAVITGLQGEHRAGPGKEFVAEAVDYLAKNTGE